MKYRCLYCGSYDGEAKSDGSATWYWRTVDFGRVGPFCRNDEALAFELNATDSFTIDEWQALTFLQWRYENQIETESSPLRTPQTP